MLEVLLSSAFLFPLSLIDLSGTMLPPRHQGFVRNTCSAFAATALAEYLIKMQHNHTEALSTEFTYCQTKALIHENPLLNRIYEGHDGAPGFLAVKSLTHGVLSEARLPYNPSSRPICSNVPSRTQIIGRFSPQRIPRDQIADFLRKEQSPVVININWYDGAANSQGFLSQPTDEKRQDWQEGQSL